MNIAIVHYHCRPGGVTRVMASAVAALRARGVNTVVLTGEVPPEGSPTLGEWRAVDWLGYGKRGPERPANALADAARDALGAEPDVWHVHNHSLGKNLSLPLAVSELARSGRRLLLQMHDFAEDGRPDNYAFLLRGLSSVGGLGRTLYPSGGGVHYAALNDRDGEYLRSAGADEERVSVLPNPVVLDEEADDDAPAAADGPFLYVTRAIRRKNLGEILLWAAAAREGERFQVTRAPKNPAQRPPYDRWVAVAEEVGLPVGFEVGERSNAPLRGMMRRARCMVTTSVAEGFGMAFLEPWLAGRAVAGRDLPEVTSGFAEEGVDLSALYARHDIPDEWVGEARVRARLKEAMAASFRAYGRALPGDAVERAMGDMARDGSIDFGRLDEPLQEEIVRRVAGSAEAKARLLPERLLAEDTPAKRIEANRRSVAERFSPQAYGERLAALYRKVAESDGPADDSLSAERLLDGFLAPERFCLLRT